MRRNTICSLAVILISSIPILFLVLEYRSRLKRLAYNFERNFGNEYIEVTRFDLKYNSYYIAGFDVDGNIYMGNYTTNPQLLKLNQSLENPQRIKIDIDTIFQSVGGEYRLSVDSTTFYLFSGTGRVLMRGNTHDWKASNFGIFCPYFQECVPVSDQSAVFRYVDATTQENSFRKESIIEKGIYNNGILEKQVDGQFCTTGNLVFNKMMNTLVYLYAYRNEILLIDTNLRLSKKYRTIDPVDTARFEVSKIRSNNSWVITKPAVLVNAECATWKSFLFVNSRIRSINEDDVTFNNSNVIDIYDLRNGEYQYSFYLPDVEGKKISSFKVHNGKIYTLSGKYLSCYNVKLPG